MRSFFLIIDEHRIWFYHVFYERLGNTQPYSGALFINGIDTVGTFMVKMISMCLGQLEDPQQYNKILKDLALRHCQRGIQANEFFYFGNVLFYALEFTLGTLYTLDVSESWKKIYSSMLTIIIPECIRFGLVLKNSNQSPQDLREQAARNKSISYSVDQKNPGAQCPFIPAQLP